MTISERVIWACSYPAHGLADSERTRARAEHERPHATYRYGLGDQEDGLEAGLVGDPGIFGLRDHPTDGRSSDRSRALKGELP